MKRVFIILLLAAALLCGCTQAAPKEPYTVTSNSMEFTVDPVARTISDGKDTYSYYIDNSDITVYYPNGAEYASRSNGMIKLGSGNYDPVRYVDGDILIDALSAQIIAPAKPRERDIPSIILGLVFVAFGIFSATAPETDWYLSRGWMFKDASPSDAVLKIIGISGIIEAIIGIVMIVVGIVGT